MSEPFSFMSDLAAADDWMTDFIEWDQDRATREPGSSNYHSMLADDSLDRLPDISLSSFPTTAGDSGTVALQSDPLDTNITAFTTAAEAEIQYEALPRSTVLSSAAPMYHVLIYSPTNCVSCDGSLDKVEQDLSFIHPTFYCSHGQEQGHLTLACQAPSCLMKFSDLKDLKTHSRRAGHVTFNCGITSCEAALTATPNHITKHFEKRHPDIACYPCAKCELKFTTNGALGNHCKVAGHAGYVCQFPDCGVECIRAKDLSRHQLDHKMTTTTYPCDHCRTYRDSNGFKRKDHLVQHMRDYHRIEIPEKIKGYCRERDDRGRRCWSSYDGLDDLTKHMLEAHHSSAYVCWERDCERVGMNGFDNNKDLKSHAKNDHISPYQCTEPRCDKVGSNGWKRKRDMVKHIEKFHSNSVDTQSME